MAIKGILAMDHVKLPTQSGGPVISFSNEFGDVIRTIIFLSIIQCWWSFLGGTLVSASCYFDVVQFHLLFREFIGWHQVFTFMDENQVVRRAQFAFHVMEAGKPNRWKRTSLCNLRYHCWKPSWINYELILR